MKTVTQVCFGSSTVEIAHLVDALAEALRRRSLSVEWSPGAEPLDITWYGYGSAGSWVHFSDPMIARELAKSVATLLGTELSLFEAFCEHESDAGTLGFQARTISSDGPVMPMASTALDGENLEASTAGFIRDRLGQILDALTCCQTSADVWHSFKVYRGGRMLAPSPILVASGRIEFSKRFPKSRRASLPRSPGMTPKHTNSRSRQSPATH